ncbi:MAG: TatD family hydrolase [Alphaproteobacteria bacterium]|nr:TatD family hydrolase [Alphaproteobacteria bacterium]MBF0129263.1 TatD family hydrolase [Alphaproteobacteria bacterium]
MLVDTHCHLDFPDFAEDLDEVVGRARRAGVSRMLTISTHVTRFDRVLAVAERHEGVYCTVGIHPHEAGKEPPVDKERLIALSRHPKVVGFGETGLDYFYEHSPREDQQRSFRVHIAAAREAGLPLIIHTRDADEDIIRILREEMARGRFRGLVHCFSSGPELAAVALDLGLLISVSGIATFNKAGPLRDTIKAVPLDHLLVETDAPFLAPVPQRGRRNEPAFVVHTAAKVAEIKGISTEALAQATTANVLKLFGKIDASGASQ